MGAPKAACENGRGCDAKASQEMKFATPRPDEQVKQNDLIQQQKSAIKSKVPATNPAQALAGCWTRKDDGLTMTFRCDEAGAVLIYWDQRFQYPPSPICKNSEGSIEMELAGNVHKATWEKNASPQRLVWSDGEVWLRTGLSQEKL